MGKANKFKDTLGQHMTPEPVATLLARELRGPVTSAVDLAVGDGALLLAIATRWPRASLHGIDCDELRVTRAKAADVRLHLRLGDGLAARFPALRRVPQQRMVVVGNPPFLQAKATDENLAWLDAAFVGVRSRHGIRRLEMIFLARALVEARKRRGLVAMLMPSPFASGVLYGPYRRALLTQYGVVKVISIEGTRFRDTEASTVLLVIDAASYSTKNVEISRYSPMEGKIVLHNGPVAPDERLDARYWSAAPLRLTGAPTLGEWGVDVTRGRYCKADANRMKRVVLHTTDLCRLSGPSIELHTKMAHGFDDADVLAEAGDILLSRTGTRVRWEPVEVKRGVAPITDHVLRIRAPEPVRRQVIESFMHPVFPAWLASVTKGVCASVLTKRDLLNMPLFAASMGRN
ncbi:methyltransferase [Achromobacter xylosoxidans]|uniref:methyltransferase n=1 Tax=Alcaligenes xylosoxydans xylosoxydans TaxID=85698 RepID=UPI0009BA0A76|nr:methyltransferase [Achromobacter xylosoxidans]